MVTHSVPFLRQSNETEARFLMYRTSLTYLATALFFTLPFLSGPASAQNSCAFEANGTTVPNTSGTPLVINTENGTVISANFFDSGAIDPPYFDGQEHVSVCVHEPDSNGITKATIIYDVGLDNDTRIKAYPQFVIGTKFGNLYETSFRYYSTDQLPVDQHWPVVADDLTQETGGFNFANLEYVSRIRGIGLPAFTNNLPSMTVTLDMDEQNVIGAERDVMLESWFYDTSANATLIGNNSTTGQPIVNTLNNIVGIGHEHYSTLDNTLLEMMVHIGPLSPNDISGATRHPGQHQLTENYSGKDFDGDGIDDHFDVDSHINANNNQEPQPGVYSSGIDNNNDGIDDADLLPVTIGSYQYSIWYGETHLAPVIIYSRETNSSLQNDFDPLTPDMDLSTEGELTLPWNEFLNYTLNELETQLALIQVDWVIDETLNPFPRMSAAGGAIGGIEFGIEPQINIPSDEPYIATINKFEVEIDGNTIGLNDSTEPAVSIHSINHNLNTDSTTTIMGSSADNVSVDRNRLLIRNIDTGEYWNGSEWTNDWSWFEPLGINNWSYDITLPIGNFRTVAWTWDTSNNSSTSAPQSFSVTSPDSIAPTVEIDPVIAATQGPGLITISGTSNDNVAIDRNKLFIFNTDTEEYWNGSAWTSTWAWFDPIGISSWSYDITLPAGNFSASAWTWDTAGHRAKSSAIRFKINIADSEAPTVTVNPVIEQSSGLVTISGTSEDNLAIDFNRLLLRNNDSGLYWDGSAWVSNWSWFIVSGTTNWQHQLPLDAGNYAVIAWTWDSAGNRGMSSSERISIE